MPELSGSRGSGAAGSSLLLQPDQRRAGLDLIADGGHAPRPPPRRAPLSECVPSSSLPEPPAGRRPRPPGPGATKTALTSPGIGDSVSPPPGPSAARASGSVSAKCQAPRREDADMSRGRHDPQAGRAPVRPTRPHRPVGNRSRTPPCADADMALGQTPRRTAVMPVAAGSPGASGDQSVKPASGPPPVASPAAPSAASATHRGIGRRPPHVSAARSRAISPVSTSPARTPACRARAARNAEVGDDARHLGLPPAPRASRDSAIARVGPWAMILAIIGSYHGLIASPAARRYRRAPRPGTARCAQRPGGGQKARRHVLGVKPRLEGVAGRCARSSCRSGSASPAATRNCHSTRSMPVIASVTGCSTCSRVFISMNQKRSGRSPSEPSTMNSTVPAPAVADRLGRAHRRLPHRGAHLGRHARRRRLLDHLLVATLQRAVALEQMHARGCRRRTPASRCGAGLSTYFSTSTAALPKAVSRLAPRAGERLGKVLRPLDPPHPLAAAAGHRLDQHRIADGIGRAGQMLRVLIRAMIARHHRHAGLFHQRLRGILQPHRPDRLRRRTDEDQPRRLDRLDEIGVFRQKPVAGMDRLGARSPAPPR